MKSFVWDTTGPLHAAKCDRTEVLLQAAGPGRQHLVPDAVAKELSDLGHPIIHDRFEVVALEGLEAILALVSWQRRLGSDPASGAHLGEAEVATLTELQPDAVAIVDDSDARRVIRRQGTQVHGVLWAISRAVVEERVPSARAFSGLCDQMLSTGIRWSMQTGGYPEWVAHHWDELL